MSDDFRPEDYIPYVAPPRVMLPDDEPGPRQPHLGYTLLLLLIGFILLLVVSAVVIAVGAALHLLPHSVAQASRGFPKTSILIEALSFGATLWAAALAFPRIWHRSFGATIEFHAQTAIRYAPRLALGGVALSVVAQLIESRLNLHKDMPVDDFFRHPADVWVVALFGVLVAPVCEEIFFRGFLLRGLAIAWDWITTPRTEEGRAALQATSTLSRNAWIVGGVVSSGLFAAMHAAQLGFAWNAVGVLWLVGGVLTVVRVRLNSVAASAIVHAVYNGFIFAILFFATDGFRHLDKVTSH
jgi:membrane protease YdiL (CAAX protease family)